MASHLTRSRTSAPTTRPSFGATRVPLKLATKEHTPICNVSSEEPSESSISLNLEEFAKRAAVVMDRYDFLSAGLGALAVTTVCVARGQDPVTALWITAASTVAALLVNDAFFTEK